MFTQTWVHPNQGTHYFDLFCTSTIFISSTFSVLRPLKADRFTSRRLLRPFVKSGLLIGREAQVEVKFGQKGRSKVVTKRSK